MIRESDSEHGGACAVTTHHLTKRYGTDAALDAVDLLVPEGAVYVLIGGNGSDPSGANPPAANQPNQTSDPTDGGEPTQTSSEQGGTHPGVYDPNADAAVNYGLVGHVISSAAEIGGGRGA